MVTTTTDRAEVFSRPAARFDNDGNMEVRASSALGCRRALWYAATGYEPTNPPSEESLTAMEAGNALEPVVVRAMERAGWKVDAPDPQDPKQSMVLEWAVGEPEPLRSQRNSYSYTEYSPATTPSGDILFTTRTVDPVAAAAEARRSGLWTSTEITDTLWPANDNRTRPLMPLRRGHMAMLVAAGFLNNLVLEADDRRILVKGRTSKDMVLVEDAPEKEVHREKLTTTVVALDLDDGQIEDIAA